MSSWYPEGSMKGSGIYSEDITLEVECEECSKTWEEDFSTDDWGNVEADIKCECGHTWTFSKEQEEIGDPHAPDRLEDY
jgi:hypothetical protein